MLVLLLVLLVVVLCRQWRVVLVRALVGPDRRRFVGARRFWSLIGLSSSRR
jgi:hypothetical protein